jgi:hypothetical protein
MFPFLLGLVGLVWFTLRGGNASPSPSPAPTPTFKGELIPLDAPKGGVSESLFGAGETPFDPLSIFGTAAIPSLDLSTGGTSGAPFDLGGFLSRAAPKAEVPAGVQVDETYDAAQAPLDSGVRVLMRLSQKFGDEERSAGVVEGLYSGPEEDLKGQPATIVVDRIAESGALELFAGRYNVPPSKRDYEHSYLERVAWTPLSPEAAGLTAVANPPQLGNGDKLTLVARDTVGNVVVWIAQVEAALKGSYEVVLHTAYKMIKDVGEGKISRPYDHEQATVVLPTTALVNPASIPK